VTTVTKIELAPAASGVAVLPLSKPRFARLLRSGLERWPGSMQIAKHSLRVSAAVAAGAGCYVGVSVLALLEGSGPDSRTACVV
jgi:hypothetical protein